MILIKNYKKQLLMGTLLATTLLIVGCTDEKISSIDSQEIIQKDTNSIIEDNSVTENPTEKTSEAKENSSTLVTDNLNEIANESNKSALTFDLKENNYYKAEFNNGWSLSSDKLYQVTLDGRGAEALEEGIASLVIKNNKTNNTHVFTLANNETAQLTPKSITWIDEKRMYLIIGFAYGTVSKGGYLYEFNIEENKLTPVIDDLTEFEEIISIKKDGDGKFTYEKLTHDEEFMNSTTEQLTIN